MASRKHLKKSIKFICEGMLTDCLVLSFIDDTNKEELKRIMSEIYALRNDMVTRISHTEPGSVKVFYKKLIDEFIEKKDQLCKDIIKA